MKIRYLFILIVLLNSCIGTGTSGLFGTGVSVAVDPRSIGTQIDDTIMQKNLSTRITLEDKKYFLAVKSKVLDGRIFITGKVDNPEDKLKITKIAWETEGVRSVRNDIKIKEEFNFKQSAKDLLITSQLRTALMFNGIAETKDELKLVVDEANSILDVEKVVASILLMEDLRIQKN